MKIEHIAIWAADLERLKSFYVEHFGLQCGPKYVNRQRGFSSYFLSPADGGARLELMHQEGLPSEGTTGPRCGLAHLAFSLGSPAAVDALTRQLQAAGCTVMSGPRVTGDGYYESAIADPEGNCVELTA